MPFRFQRLTTTYPEFTSRLLADNPDWPELSHAALYARCTAACFAETDFHAVHLRRQGHPAENHFLSIEPLQKRWAAENNVQYRPQHWVEDIALAQVEAFQPDVVWLDDLYLMDGPFRRRVRQACRGQVLLVGWRSAPTTDFKVFADLDLVLTSIPSMVDQFRAGGANAALLHHAFEPSILETTPAVERRDVALSFAGGVGALHPERAALIEALIDRTPLELWIGGRRLRTKDRVRHWLGRLGMPQRRKWRMQSLALRYPDRVHPSVFGVDYYRVLARSKIVLNAHISCAGDSAANMRLFEATGMGACLLTDHKRNLPQLFELDRDAVAYRNPDECAEQVHRLLANDALRRSIAQAGQRRTLRDHTYARRVEQLVDMLETSLSRRAA